MLPSRLHSWPSLCTHSLLAGATVEGCSLGVGFCVTVVPVQREEHGERPAPSHELDSVGPRAAFKHICTLQERTLCAHAQEAKFMRCHVQDYRLRPVCQLSAAPAADAVRGGYRA